MEEQERQGWWSSLTRLRTSASGESQDGSAPAAAATRRKRSNQSTSTGHRYAHDLQHAQALRGPAHPPQAMPSQTKQLSTSDVQLGMEGLAEAKALSQKGDMAGSLKLYELSLELLLTFLQQAHPSPPTSGTADSKAAVHEVVRVAMGEAEQVKAQLKRERQTTSEPSKESHRTSRSHLTQSISSVLSSQPRPSTRGKSSGRADPSSRVGPSTAVNEATSDPIMKIVDSEMLVDSRNSSGMASTTWSDVAGLDNVKTALKESAILPLLRPDLYTGLRRPHNLLLYGPPGTGKTLLVRAVAQQSPSTTLFVCSASSLTSKWMGDSEKVVRALFQRARELSPSLIFVDEIDSVLSQRQSAEHEASRRLKTEFMVQMDGLKQQGNADGSSHVLVLACTNCPWDLDTAVLRRFPRRLYVPLPDRSGRASLWDMLLTQMGSHRISKRQLSRLVDQTEGFSGSDLTAVASEAALAPLRECDVARVQAHQVRPVTYKDVLQALENATRSVSDDQLEHFRTWEEKQSTAGK